MNTLRIFTQWSSYSLFIAVTMLCWITCTSEISQKPGYQAITSSSVTPLPFNKVVTSSFPIYLASQNDETIAIWQLGQTADEAKIIYEATIQLDPIETVFSANALQRLIDSQPDSLPLNLEQVYSRTFITELTWSEQNRLLTWFEFDFYCAENQSDCLNVGRLGQLNPSQAEPAILHSIPDVPCDRLNPTLSANRQYVATSCTRLPPAYWPLEEIAVITVDIQTEQIVTVTTVSDLRSLPGRKLHWSPITSTLALYIVPDWLSTDSGGIIRFFNADTNASQDITLDRLWIRDLEWSPTGEQMAFSATITNPQLIITSDQIGLYLLDRLTGLTQEIVSEPGQLFENPRWSPDGQLLAIDRRSKPGDFFDSLLVIDVASGAFIYEFMATRLTGTQPNSLIWNDDNRSILIVTGVKPDRSDYGLVIVNLDDDSVTPVELPEELPLDTISFSNITW